MPTFNNGESGASVREKINEAINKVEGIETSLVNINAKLDVLFSANIPDLFANGEQGAWYDPSDLTTLYQDAAGTTLVTADGDPVGYMADKSGNGNHATQSTAAARPVYRTDGTLHWLEFDGVDDFLALDGSFAVGQASFMCIGVENYGDTKNQWFFGGSTTASGRNTHFGFSDGNNIRYAVFFYDLDVAADWQGQARVLSAIHDVNQDRTVRMDGSNFGSDNGPFSSENPGWGIGGMPATNNYGSINFFGCVFLGADVSGNDISLTENYLAKKTGVTL